MKDAGDRCNNAPPAPEEDRARANPPGRAALSYRLGTHGTFLRRMLAAVPVQTIPGAGSPVRPLATLHTRASEDAAIALLDAWAVTADVLTFYQERIANEGFLRTATERRSVLELARGVGHELAPGVAASVHVAFTVEDATPSARVPAGTRVQSLPGQDEAPQTFETTADIEARAEWNSLRPRRSAPQDIGISGLDELFYAAPGAAGTPGALYLRGTSTNLRPGDALLVHRAEPVQGGGGTGTLTFTVHRVVLEPAEGRTRVEITSEPGPLPGEPVEPGTTVPVGARPLEEAILGSALGEDDLSVQIALRGASRADLTRHVQRALSAPAQPFEVHALRQRVSFFGHNAPPFQSTPVPLPPSGLPEPSRTVWNDAWAAQSWDNGRQIWQDSTLRAWPANVHAVLERVVPELVPGGWVVLRDPSSAGVASGLDRGIPFRLGAVVEISIADYSLSSKASGLLLLTAGGERFTPSASLPFQVRTSSALVQSERLELADLPIVAPLARGATRIALDRLVLGLSAGRAVWITGERADRRGASASEIAVLAGVIHDHGRTTLLLGGGLESSYVRDTVTINANVALATHGETVAREVLGSGDASREGQRFTLKKQPVVYLSAPTQTGVASTVSIRVNDVPWREVPSLFGQGPNDQVYTLSTDDDGRTSVIFGDGRSGARVPTGRENIVATYRSAATARGSAGAGALTLIQARPLGVRSVTNPLPAAGGQGPDSLEEGRVNAPFAALTLDRAVTALDYEDFVRAFGGIGKAKAAVLHTGRSRVVHVSVVSDRGETIDRRSALHANLLRALFEASDPDQEVRIDGADVRPFDVTAELVVDPLLSTGVLERAKTALLSTFSLGRRDLGQDVTPAEVIAALQAVPGVIAALVTRLSRRGEPAGARLATLSARAARIEAGVIAPAELLLLDRNGIHLTEIRA